MYLAEINSETVRVCLGYVTFFFAFQLPSPATNWPNFGDNDRV